MTQAMRWRIISLQAVLVLVAGMLTGLAFWGSGFATGQVQDQLAAQKIYFPPASTIVAGGALDPAEFPKKIRDQAGNQVVSGEQARIYANDFIGVHLQKVAGGQTYAQVSTAAMAATDPTQKAALNAQKTTLFQGETLRASLLNGYGWWTVGKYAGYAAYALALATLVVLGALVFEVVVLMSERRRVLRAIGGSAPTTQPVLAR